MKFFCYIFISLSISLTAEQVHSNAQPGPKLEKLLKLKISRFKVGGLSAKKTIEELRRAVKQNDPEKRDINIIFLEQTAEHKQKVKKALNKFNNPPPDDPFEDDPFEDLDIEDNDGDGVAIAAGEVEYNFDFANMPLEEIVKFICLAGGMKYRIDTDALVIADREVYLKPDDKWTEKFIKTKLTEKQKAIAEMQREAEILEKMLKGEKTVVKTIKPKTQMQENLEIVIKQVNFEDEDMTFIADFLKRVTRDVSSDGRGVNIIVKLDKNVPKINIKATDLKLKDLLDYMAEQMNVEYKLSENAITFQHQKSFFLPRIKYTVNEKLLELMKIKGQLSFRQRFKELGINSFPLDEVTFHQKDGILEILTTKENHAKIKKLIDASLEE